MGWCASPGVSWAVSRSSVVMALSEPINSSPWMVTERGCLATQGGALFDWRSSASRVQPVSNRSELGKGQERCNLVNGLGVFQPLVLRCSSDSVWIGGSGQ
eukprot:scaffold152626_cov27-Tisochrysis_lutea.AAC.1